MIKLVVIDFDDTLSLTEEACYYLENEVAAQLGFPPMTREAHLKNWGKVLEEAIVERIPGVDVDEFMSHLEKVHEQYIIEGKIDVIPKENIEFLDWVRESDRKLAILTSRSLLEVKHLLQDGHPLNARVERFYHKDNSEYLKPDPRVFNKILKDFDTQPEVALYLGDSIGDAVSAKNAGLHFVAVLASGIRSREDFHSVPVDYFATTLSEARSYILTAG